jgi:hypothetical protein
MNNTARGSRQSKFGFRIGIRGVNRTLFSLDTENLCDTNLPSSYLREGGLLQ